MPTVWFTKHMGPYWVSYSAADLRGLLCSSRGLAWCPTLLQSPRALHSHRPIFKVWLCHFPFFFFFLGPYLCTRLRGMEPQLLSYATATAILDLSRIYNLCHSLRQHWIPNPLSEARDWTRNLIVPSRIHFHCTTTGTPCSCFVFVFVFFDNILSHVL